MDLRSRRVVGGGVWGVGLVVALVWGSLDGSGAEGVGYGFSPPINVAALEAGRIKELPVSLHGSVAPDQVVVRMDPAPLLDEKQIAEAELLAIQEEAAMSAMGEARRFAEGVEGVLVDQARISAGLQEDLALAGTLRERLSLEEDLAASGASSTQAVEEFRRQLRVVDARIQAGRASMQAATRAANNARARNADLPAPNQWAVVAATRTVEALEGRIQRYDLRAGIEGQVTWIYKAEGEVVAAGDPVLQVRRMGTTEVVAFFRPSQVSGIERGSTATVKRTSGQVLHGRLVSVGAGPQVMPEQLWKLPNWPEYGVPIVVEVDSDLAPDEAVTVRI